MDWRLWHILGFSHSKHKAVLYFGVNLLYLSSVGESCEKDCVLCSVEYGYRQLYNHVSHWLDARQQLNYIS